MRKLRDMLEDEGGFPTFDIVGCSIPQWGSFITDCATCIPQIGSFMVDFTACIPDWITCLTSFGGVLDAVADIADTVGFLFGK